MKRNLCLIHALVPLLLFVVFSIACLSRITPTTEFKAENAFDSPDEAQRYFLEKRLPHGETILPVERYVAAALQMEKMQVYSTATNTFSASPNQVGLGPWEELGPGNIGGRTRALLIDPSNPSIIYAGGVAGGIWKTTDGGQNWIPKSQTVMPIISINCLASGSDDSRSRENVLLQGTSHHSIRKITKVIESCLHALTVGVLLGRFTALLGNFNGSSRMSSID